MGSIPRVSIGLPVRNGEKYLAGALDALLGQTYADFELLVSDNASTDSTPHICRDYAARDRRIRYCRAETDMGLAWNFNRAFSLARGEYFKWAAYDDVCAPTFVERCVDVLDRRPDVAWCFPRFSHIDPWGNLLEDPAACNISYLSADGLDRAAPQASRRFRAVLLGGGSCLDNYSVVRRKVMAQTVLQLPYYGADKVFIADLCLYGRYAEVPETLFFVRVHPDGSGNLPSAAQQQAFTDPRGGHHAAFTRFNLLASYLRIIRRAPTLGGVERARCYASVLRYLVQVRKWRRVVQSLLRGIGTGGAYLDPLRRLKRRPPKPPSLIHIDQEPETTEATANQP
jgi:glycosyltransferase involved in cell wall biosynthesis